MICPRCEQDRNARRFIRGVCRNCAQRERYANDPEFRRRQQAATLAWGRANPEHASRKTREWQRAHPDKIKAPDPIKAAARGEVNKALKRGDLVRGPCEIGRDCRGRVQAHHDDYGKPLDVRWLCSKHHGEEHARERTDA